MADRGRSNTRLITGPGRLGTLLLPLLTLDGVVIVPWPGSGPGRCQRGGR